MITLPHLSNLGARRGARTRLAVLKALLRLSKDGRSVFTTLPTICQRVKRSKCVVWRGVVELCRLGLLQRVGSRRGCLYSWPELPQRPPRRKPKAPNPTDYYKRILARAVRLGMYTKEHAKEMLLDYQLTLARTDQ
jgi:hypothetical protein